MASSQQQQMLEQWARHKSRKAKARRARYTGVFDSIKKNADERGFFRPGSRPGGMRPGGMRPGAAAPPRRPAGGGGADVGPPAGGEKKDAYWQDFWSKVNDLRTKSKSKQVEGSKRTGKKHDKKKKRPSLLRKQSQLERQDSTIQGRSEVKEDQRHVKRTDMDLHTAGKKFDPNKSLPKFDPMKFDPTLQSAAARERAKLAGAVNAKMEYYKNMAKQELKRRRSTTFASNPDAAGSTKPGATRGGRAHSTAAAEQFEQFQSNVDRYYAEEKARKERMKARKANARRRFNIPKNMEEAKTAAKQFFNELNGGGGGSPTQAHTETSYSTKGVKLPSKYAGLSVGELVRRLKKLKVSIAGVREKKDLIKKLQVAEAEVEAKEAEEKARRDKIELGDRILREVKRWARGKGIKEMLNSICDLPKHHPRYLNRLSGFDAVNRAYKHALIKIHPDKNMHSFEALTRATEKFKIVNGAFTAYKKRHDR